MMTGAQALDMVMLRLVRSDSTTRAGLLLEMNQLIHTRLESGAFIPWFLYREDTSASTVANTETVAFPTGFIRFDDDMEIGGISYLDSTITTPDQYVPLVRIPGNKLKGLYADQIVSTPEAFDLSFAGIQFRPIPDASYALKIGAMFHDADVADDNNATLWLTHAQDLVIAETTLIGATLYTRDKDLVEIAMAERNASMARLRAAHTAFIESMQERMMGDD